MKTPIFKSLHSKAAKGLLAITIITLASVTACKKDSNNSSSPTVTEADAAQLTSDAIEPTSGGMTIQANSSVTIYASASTKLSCGVSKDTTITGASVYRCHVCLRTVYLPISLSWNYQLKMR